jgi:hypothetical protein
MPSARVVSMMIDLLLAVLEIIAVVYLGDQPYTPEEETILQIINNFRDTLSDYTVAPATYTKAGKKRPRSTRVPDAKAGKKRSRSTRGSGGDARDSSDNDDEAPSDDNEAGAGPSDTRRQVVTDSPTMCSVCGKKVCPVCGKCHGSPFWSPASSDCVEVEVVEDSPVAMTVSSSGDDGPKGGSSSDSSSVSPAALRFYRSAAEDENTGGADAGLKEGQDVPSSSSSDDDGEK